MTRLQSFELGLRPVLRKPGHTGQRLPKRARLDGIARRRGGRR